MEKGIHAAIRRFPLKGQEIKRLALANSTFRAICDDLADAQLALDQWSQSSSLHRAARLSEYQVLTEELASEIKQFLGTASGEP